MTLCLLDTTILLGLTFLAIQFMEYNVARFNISDGIYGSIFYLLTGFHGFHVLVGVIFLIITRFRIANKKVNAKDHGSFEFAS
jgi:heme/copper-type cytochrome/quinol oxidase subunit 3